ncbi:radical SAM protein [Synechococcus sp. PCC 6312]|uniref:radical SAM protein n=1 Tax=Synechococcus sp. (strain ATCC 27167 / PCC 6312) TaxID=195253 RepID=UPI00029EF311|nr:radical SAM protein [Synechococcus sp. PCC 6312]AFY61111.1 radical SAM superfamily enzyme [Synechococcus sp. PCC 6312]
MKIVRNLELHIIHNCNLHCESCAHYSNQYHQGLVTLGQAARWFEQWQGRVQPISFSLLGGEPTLHPQLAEFVPLVKKYFPHSKLRLVTNGFFLERHPDLPRFLRSYPRAELHISIHHDSPEYLSHLQPQLDLVFQWQREYEITIKILNSQKYWTRRYYGIGSQMEPFADNQPRQSWENCPAKHCLQLFQGQLWKCPPLAYLQLQAKKYSLSEYWQPYLNYTPLSSNCTEPELHEFLGREDESYCAMCPSNPKTFSLPNPITNISVK